MRKQQCLFISIAEAYKMLVEHFVDVVINDRQKLVDCICARRFDELCPNLSAMNATEMAKMIKALNLAEIQALSAGAYYVFVALDDTDDNFFLVWDYRRMEGDDDKNPVATFLLKEKQKKEQLVDFL